jgi:hypothetical protein
MSPSFDSALVAAVARIECTQNACRFGILDDDIAVDGARIEVPVESAGAVVGNGSEEGFVQVLMFLPPAVFQQF